MWRPGRQGYQQADNNAFVTIGRNDFFVQSACATPCRQDEWLSVAYFIEQV